MNSTIELVIFELVIVMEFQLKLKILIFGPNLPKKGYFHSQIEKKGPANFPYYNYTLSRI